MQRWTQTVMMRLDPVVLSPSERRVLHQLRVATRPRPCPSCGQAVSRVDASGIKLDDYPALDEPKVFKCTHCGVGLRPCSPLIASDGPFFWAKASG